MELKDSLAAEKANREDEENERESIREELASLRHSVQELSSLLVGMTPRVAQQGGMVGRPLHTTSPLPPISRPASNVVDGPTTLKPKRDEAPEEKTKGAVAMRRAVAAVRATGRMRRVQFGRNKSLPTGHSSSHLHAEEGHTWQDSGPL